MPAILHAWWWMMAYELPKGIGVKHMYLIHVTVLLSKNSVTDNIHVKMLVRNN